MTMPEDVCPEVVVVVVNWNGKEFLGNCLESLRVQTHGNYSVIVVDNGSTDGSVDLIRSGYPEVRLIQTGKNLGFAAANNIAIQSCQAEYIALLNNDATARATWLEHLVDALATHAEAGMAASKMVFADAPDIIDRAGDAYTLAGAGCLRGRGRSSDAYNQNQWIFGACAGAALYRKKMLHDIGLFDEAFFLIYEDVDLSFRAQLSGYKCLYVADAVVEHAATSSIKYDSEISVYYGHRNLEWNYIKNMPTVLILLTIVPHLAYNIAGLLFFGLRGRGWPYLKAKYAALKGAAEMLAKRERIQAESCVPPKYILSLLHREFFFSRLFARAAKGK
jgi:GT2 family glycosyltransferase